MPYPADHKSQVRARIVNAAARLFRRAGYARTSVGDLMKAAGLTHGGFYAHFRDKDALFLEAIERAFDQAEENLLGRGLEQQVAAQYIEAAGRRYLSMRHRDEPEEGCLIPALGAEIARSERSVREVFEQRLERLASAIAGRFDAPRPAARAQAFRALATWVGAQVLARAVYDPAVAKEILLAARSSQ